MTWEPRPTPNVNPETEPYWEAAADERLLVQECQDCGLVYAYPRALCPDCFSNDVEWVEAEGTGEVYTYTVSRQMSGWPEEDLPLILAYVELDEGPRITTNIVDCDPEEVEVGTPVEVQFVDTEDDSVGIPVFTPV
jgi:uncharacterized OB-fold protein